MDIRGLAYVVAECSNPGRWRRYGEDVLGMMARDAPGQGVYLKMDERPFRFLVERGDRDRFVACGWELADDGAFRRAADALARAGVTVHRGSADELVSRKVQDLVWCQDPSGNRHELFWGVRSDFVRFDSPQDVPRFVTEPLGMGHVVLPAPRFDETWTFFRDILGFGLSDIYRHRLPGVSDAPEQRIHFCHCSNGRHHSVALFEADVPSGCGHVMVEVDSVTEVGRAHDRMQRHGVRLMASLGQHVNDRMVSFYMLTPSGFSLEFGCGGRVLDWSRHSVFEATETSLWGHDWSLGLAG